jgi:hypothetical protein
LPAEIALGIVLVLGLPFAALSIRRRFLSRSGGAIEMSLRLKSGSYGRGWVLGVGRFNGDELQWFRVFSLSSRPRRTLSRAGLSVKRRRVPKGIESRSLLKGVEILELLLAGSVMEVAMDPSAITGFLAWLEARPPGATLP